MDRNFDRFQKQLDKKREDEDKDRKRKGGAALIGGASTPGAVGMDWSSPAAILHSAWQAVFLSPHTGWLRAALGLGLALQLAWVGSAFFLGKIAGPKHPEGGAVWFPRRPPPSAAVNARPPLENLVRGLKYLFAPPLVERDAAADAYADDGTYGAGGGEGYGAVPSGGPPGFSEDAHEGGEEDAASDEGGAAAMNAMGGGLAPGGGSSAGASSGLGAGAAAGAGGGKEVSPKPPSTAKSKALKRDMRAARGKGMRTSDKRKAGKLSALRQLRFSEKKSNSAKYSGKSGQAYSEAANAFGEGQAGAPPIDGAGAGTDGSGVGTSATDEKTVVPPSENEEICPSGTVKSGGVCVPVSGENKTPYQGILDQAKMFLFGAAAMAALGLFLLTRTGNPMAQIIGGILLGAAAALVLAAVSIGNFIGDKYGQETQASIVQNSGDRAMDGQNPE